MSCHLHRDALRDSSADEVAHGRPAKVVQDSARTSSFGAGRPECNPKAFDRLARSVEHARTDDTEPSLFILGDHPLPTKKFAQFHRHRERTPFAVLRLARIESDFPSGEIDLSPLERQNLAVDPPASDVRKGRRR